MTSPLLPETLPHGALDRWGTTLYRRPLSGLLMQEAIDGGMTVSVETDQIVIWETASQRISRIIPTGALDLGTCVGITTRGEVLFWSAHPGEENKKQPQHRFRSLSLDGDGPSLKDMLTLEAPNLSTPQFSVSRNGRVLLCLRIDQYTLWSVPDGEQLMSHKLMQWGTHNNDITLSADGELVLVVNHFDAQSGSDWSVYSLLEVRSGQTVLSGRAHEMDTVALSQDKRTLLIHRSRGDVLNRFDLETRSWKQAADSEESEEPGSGRRWATRPHVMSVSANGALIATDEWVQDLQRRQRRAMEVEKLRDAAFCGDKLYSVNRQGELFDHDAKAQHIEGRSPKTRLVRFSLDGRRLALYVRSAAPQLRVLDTESRREVANFPLDFTHTRRHPIRRMACGLERLAIYTQEQLKLWPFSKDEAPLSLDLSNAIESLTGRRLYGFDVLDFHFSSPADRLMVLTLSAFEKETRARHHLLLIQRGAEFEQVLCEDEGRKPLAAAIFASGRSAEEKLAVAWSDGIELWTLDPFELKRSFHGGHLGEVQALRFSPDGRTLYSRGRHTTLVAWDACLRGERFEPLSQRVWEYLQANHVERLLPPPAHTAEALGVDTVEVQRIYGELRRAGHLLAPFGDDGALLLKGPGASMDN